MISRSAAKRFTRSSSPDAKQLAGIRPAAIRPQLHARPAGQPVQFRVTTG